MTRKEFTNEITTYFDLINLIFLNYNIDSRIFFYI